MLNILRPYELEFTSAVHRSFLDDLRRKERAKMDQYITTREYDEGIHKTQLTDRTRQYLNLHDGSDFVANYCTMVIDAKANRLTVTGFETENEANDIYWNWWRFNRMDRKQAIIHRAAIRDGDAFVLAEWDAESNMPRFHYESAYAGDGVMVYYSEERRDEIAFASKSWRTEHGTHAGKERRINLYFPDRIEKYISTDHVAGGAMLPYNDGVDEIREGKLGTAGVVWWTDTRTESGQPLGVPIVHFKHNDNGGSYGRSHIENVMPLQDALNKSLIDVLAASDANGFGLLVGYGTTEWNNAKVGPGAIASVNLSPSDAKLERLSSDSPQGLLQVYNALVTEIARVSGTPLSYLQSSGQVAAEGTMKQQEIALISQVQKTQTNFGNAWEDVMLLARRMHNAFSPDESIDETSMIDTIWEQAELRNDKEQAETLALKVEKLGISEEQAQIELGYNATQIASFARAKLRQQAFQVRSLGTPAQGFNNGPQNTLTQTEVENDEARTESN